MNPRARYRNGTCSFGRARLHETNESLWREEDGSEVRAVEATLHPVLVADLADEGARDFLEGVSIGQGCAVVPLLAAPIDGSLHVLEIHTPHREPLVVYAEPIGAPTRDGFPLRLKPIVPVASEGVVTLDDPEAIGGALRPRTFNRITLTERHTHDLSGTQREATPESLVGRTLAEQKLEVTALVGVGGAGAVYRALHRALRIPLAVKILHESFQTDIEFCRRFHAEALSASRLDHVNVVRVIDFGQEPDGLLYIAMEYLDGIPLSRVVEKEAPVPLPRLVSIMSQVLAALAHAHARGIVHRDVKPDNVVLVCSADDEGVVHERVKVCDFGIAVPAFDARSARSIAGTPHYMSPEQVSGEPLDGRSDVYACGVLLYELATGRVPFGDGDARTIAACHVRATPAPPSSLVPTIDPALERIILKALAKDPSARHQNARELRNELRALVAEAPPSSSREPEWIERGSDAFVSALTSSSSHRAVASEIVTSTTEWLQRWVQTVKREDFLAMAEQLEETLPALVATGDAKAVASVRTTLDLLSSGSDVRATCAVRLLQTLRDPKLLGGLAESLLLGKSTEDGARLLLGARTPAAYALYSARLKLSGDDVRQRFVALVRAFGADAVPMMRAGLVKLFDHQNVPVAVLLAEDLLTSVPSMHDDALGEVVAPWVRAKHARVQCAAIDALARVWGERSRPVLLAFLGASNDAVRAASARALGAMNGLDDLVARKIAEARSELT